jgi:hypothetical protein
MRHIESANRKDHPTMVAYAKMNWDEIWSRPVDLQVREKFAFYEEQFMMILENLLNYENTDTVIIEGAAFLPSLIQSWNMQPHRAIFFNPKESISNQALLKRTLD